MAGERIRGQETFINILDDGGLVDQIDSIQEFEFTHNIELQEEEFLGEEAPRFDMIFKGTSVRVSGQLTNRRFLEFQQRIRDKAARREGAAARFDITSTFIFPNGATYTIAFEDIAFSSMPVTTSSRTDFTKWTLEGSVTSAREVV